MKYNFLDWRLIREGGLFEGGGLIDHLRYVMFSVQKFASGLLRSMWFDVDSDTLYTKNISEGVFIYFRKFPYFFTSTLFFLLLLLYIVWAITAGR